ncbi:MAG: hypothetical protein IJX99_04070 [Clostridia bacterium]|nr:hypothetical protein [Clostridia bacterium]
MILTQLQKELIQEMVEQGTSKDVVNKVISRLETAEQQEEMMKYLVSNRKKNIL